MQTDKKISTGITTKFKSKGMTWYVMRDLTRANAKRPAWLMLKEAGYHVFTPLRWKIRVSAGRKERYQAPVIHDLLFVESTREQLDPLVNRIPTLQYRFKKGGAYGEAMTVNHEEMDRFIKAINSTDDVLYYDPTEITSSMIGKKVRIEGGPLAGMTGNLLSIRGMRKRRLIVELPGMLTSAVEVASDFISFI